MRHYFQVGEPVILQSSICPEHNGDAVVTHAFSDGDCTGEDGKTRWWATTICYRLDIDVGVGRGPDKVWAQTSLRKKHDGAGDFESMINGLKTPLGQEQ